MKKMNGTICHVISDVESEVYVGSGKCMRCKYNNGKLSTGENGISCLMPRI